MVVLMRQKEAGAPRFPGAKRGRKAACNAHCYTSKRALCVCICGGANHGIGAEEAEARLSAQGGTLEVDADVTSVMVDMSTRLMGSETVQEPEPSLGSVPEPALGSVPESEQTQEPEQGDPPETQEDQEDQEEVEPEWKRSGVQLA